jgi:type II secretory pathway component GspD/PulD (secretin)
VLGGGGLGALGGGGAPLGGAAGAAGLRPLLPLTLTGVSPEGAPLIDLRLTVDPRTNSLILAGTQADLDTIEAIIDKLESTDVGPQARKFEVVTLNNASAPDVANALTTFLSQSISVVQAGGLLSQFEEIEQQVVVIAEPITNKLLISATPRYFAEVMRLIAELDAPVPEVVIQVLIAEVDLTGNEEFGVEIGLQSPVLFQRSVFPAWPFQPHDFGPGNLFGAGSATFTGGAAAAGNNAPTGVTLNTVVNPAAQPGFLFNTTAPLGNNPVVGPGIVGFQGLTNLGVGRTSTTVPNGPGGFIFSASSDSFNLLVRALKTQGRLDVLSRPQVMTLDQQTANVNIGQIVPYVTATVISGTGLATNSVAQQQVGVILNVTPRITPDGKVYMRVQPEVSSLSTSTVTVSAGVAIPIINQQAVTTTVVAQDGETVVLGGLITRNDNKNENKVPWLGDLPGVGALFRFRTQMKEKRELLLIMTPHIVRSRAEADHILAEEAARMDWIVGDVVKVHGTTGLEPIIPPPVPGSPAGPIGDPPYGLDGAVPAGPPLAVPPAAAPGAGQQLPMPAPVQNLPAPAPVQPMPAPSPAPGTAPPPASTAAPVPPIINTAARPTSLSSAPPMLPPAVPPPGARPAADLSEPTPDQGKESRRWQYVPRNN